MNLQTFGRARVALATLTATAVFYQGTTSATAAAGADLFDLDLEALTKVEVKSAAGLTKVDARRAPVALTELDARDIQLSGARDLNQLLELYVPNVQFIDHHHLQAHLGFRGIISDREDKYLFQVNGRTMNNRMLLGADNERAIPLLGDIRAVNVVRGPASATHGAGAVAGVIALEAYNGLTFQGGDLKLRGSVIDEYAAAEFRYGAKTGENAGFFVYYGLADQGGADADYYIGRSFAAANGLPANVAGQPSAAPLNTYGQPAQDDLRHKFHFSYVNGPLEVWLRFVQDGNEDRPMREIYTMAKPAATDVNDWVRGRQIRNRQTTATIRYKKELSPQWSVDLVQSFDRWSFLDQRHGVYTLPTRDGREDESFTRAIAVWTPDDHHSLGFGADFSFERFYDPPNSDALDRAPVVTDRDWNTKTLSFLAEYQWKLSDRLTTFLSARTDKHTYSDWLFSPRGTLVYSLSDRDTVKLMVGKAVRRGGDEELWAENVRKGTIPKPESLTSYELSYSHSVGQGWSFGASGFYQDYDAIGWVPALYLSSSIGQYGIAGADLQVTYTTSKTRLVISEGIAKLTSAKLPSTLPIGGQGITAKPYGYGDDLAEWAPYITKVAVIHYLNRQWSVNASAVHYSGLPGAKDYAEFARTFPTAPSAMPVSDPGYETPYGASLFVNAGVEYRPSVNVTWRLDASNLADLLDDTLSKRNYYFRLSEFSVAPASASLSVQYRF